MQRVGGQAPPKPSWPHYSRRLPPRRPNFALIFVVVVVVVVGLSVMVYILASLTMQFNPPVDGNPGAIGLVVSRTADGLYWNLTFTSVPLVATQNGTTLTLTSGSGATLLPATTMFHLEGSGVNGVKYIPFITGSNVTSCADRDRVLIANGTGTNNYPAGTQYLFTIGSTWLASGTLR
jgi:hypothetical protein